MVVVVAIVVVVLLELVVVVLELVLVVVTVVLVVLVDVVVVTAPPETGMRTVLPSMTSMSTMLLLRTGSPVGSGAEALQNAGDGS